MQEDKGMKARGKVMKNIEVIIMLPLAIISLLLLMVIDLVRMVRGKQTMDEEWHDIYMDSNMNHGQGCRNAKN